MNESPPQIEIVKPFCEAFELMKTILFKPFDVRKWFVIGFAAWLSKIGGGSYNFRARGKDWQSVPGYQEARDAIRQVPAWILISGVGFLLLLICTLLILFAWLRARGSFMFVDCIVRNRGAAVEPWREFRAQGNSYFLFTVIVGCILLVVLAVASLPFMLPIIRGVTFLHLHDAYLFSMIALWAVLLFILILAWNLISHFTVAIMYGRRCGAIEAFNVALGLIWNYPGEITLYCLFWIALGIAATIAACATILFTCCVALLPYIGTVIMLPIFVCLRGFGLYFIRQFGLDYDVWATVRPPTASEQPPLPG
jgi:hypothetical protein